MRSVAEINKVIAEYNKVDPSMREKNFILYVHIDTERSQELLAKNPRPFIAQSHILPPIIRNPVSDSKSPIISMSQ